MSQPLDEAWRRRAEEFRELLSRFCEHEIPASDFERLYLRAFKECEVQLPQPLFEILNELFLDVDSYCPDPSLRDASDLDEDQLRLRTASALAALQRL